MMISEEEIQFLQIESDIDEDVVNNNSNDLSNLKLNISFNQLNNNEERFFKNVTFIATNTLYSDIDSKGNIVLSKYKNTSYYYNSYDLQTEFVNKNDKVKITSISKRIIALTVTSASNVKYHYAGYSRFVELESFDGLFNKSIEIDLFNYIVNNFEILIDDDTPEYIKNYIKIKEYVNNVSIRKKNKFISALNKYLANHIEVTESFEDVRYKQTKEIGNICLKSIRLFNILKLKTN
jgi:hypothetical protein